MSELSKLGTQFDKVAKEARGLDQRMNSLYEDMGNILGRYYEVGEGHVPGHDVDDDMTPEKEKETKKANKKERKKERKKKKKKRRDREP